MNTLVPALRSWTRDHDPHVRAAVELLITHDDGMWLRRTEFVDAFVDHPAPGREATIDFAAVAAALDSDTAPGASNTELGILRLAADLATDRWRLSRMSDTTIHLVRVATATE